MTYYSLLTIVIALFVSGEIYLLGKYISKTSSIFKFNEPATIVMGAILYFFVTFFVFFAFVWLEPSIMYYVIIFFIKESIQVMFLVLRREVFIGMKVNWRAVIFTALAMIAYPAIFNTGLSDILGLTHVEQVNDFQTWNLYGDIMEKFTKINRYDVSAWLMGSIASMIIYNSVAAFVIEFSRKKNIWDYTLAFFAALGLMFIFNFGQRLEDMTGIFLLLFAIQLSVHIMMESRRRYAVMMGLLDIVLWFFQPQLFLTIVVLSIIVVFLYTYLKKNKASLFLVQLVSPILLVSALWLYSISEFAALFLVIISISLYLFMISIGRLETLDKLNNYLIKFRIVLPSLFIAGITIAGITLFSTRDISMKDTWLFNAPMFDTYGNHVWNEIQKYAFYPLVAVLISISAWSLYKEHTIINMKLALVLSTIVLFLAYTAFMNIVTLDTTIDGQFKYIRGATMLPISLIGIMKLRKTIRARRKHV